MVVSCQRKALVPSAEELNTKAEALEEQILRATNDLEQMPEDLSAEMAAVLATEIKDLEKALKDVAVRREAAEHDIVQQVTDSDQISANPVIIEGDEEEGDETRKKGPAQLAKRRASTWVKAIGYHEATDTTLVEVTLGTGQRHQIRTHLSFIGHPIANDKTYGGVAFPASISKRLYPAEHREEIGSFFAKHRDEHCVRCAFVESVLSGADTSVAHDDQDDQQENGRPGIYLTSGIWLHAWRYEIDEYSFVSEPPPWYITNEL